MDDSTRPSFREALSAGRFAYGAEVVTTRGPSTAESPAKLLDVARALLDDPRIAWISVTDNPGGGPMLPPDWLAGIFPDARRRIVLHLTCKDMNRNGLEAAAWRYASEGCDNILAITGDYPTAGFGGLAEPVFDLDSIGLISLLRSMNEGLRVPGRRGQLESLSRTNFFIGCVVSPFKQYERELVPQYLKLIRKIQLGAAWVIPQLGYDMRKFNEIKLLLASRGLDVPVVGNVYLLSRFVAKLFHGGKLAGCVVSDELLEKCEKYAAGPDKGRAFFQELAAKQLAVFKGLGFAAGYLGGINTPEQFGQIIDQAESYGPDDWRDFLPEIRFARPGEFFLFEHDPKTGLGDPTRMNPEYVKSLARPRKPKDATLGYWISRKVHALAFERGRGIYGLVARLFRWLYKNDKPGVLGRMAYWLEREAKHVGYGCEDCGDCSLPDCAYLCPNAACSKGSRNGPCGGSCRGRCELDDKECFWARVYERLKYYGESETMFNHPPVLQNAQLKHTSAWANTYLDRDHHAPPASDAEEKENKESS
ncbi:MAG: methylenetetrahydrofolate reductase C-terminal domain-containing protein [Pirellulales bacterium]|nr:methylenetetrahydrofolate reductase C-terminal domain-containing protein [Pirellulales bacterium]